MSGLSGVGFKFEPKLSGCRVSGLNLELECRVSGFSLKNRGYMSHALALGYMGIGLSIFLSLTGWSGSPLLRAKKRVLQFVSYKR